MDGSLYRWCMPTPLVEASRLFNDVAKHAQDLRYGTPEQQRAYANPRNAVEGENGYVKTGDFEGLGEPSRRPVRGLAAQTFLCGFLTAASSLRNIRNWLREAPPGPDGRLRRPKEKQPVIATEEPAEAACGHAWPPRHLDCPGAIGQES